MVRLNTFYETHFALHFLIHILYVANKNQAEGRKGVKSFTIYLRVLTGACLRLG